MLSLAALGYQDQEIGEELGISYHTLRTYWTRIRFRVGGGSRQALTAAYIDMRLREAGINKSVAELVQLPSSAKK